MALTKITPQMFDTSAAGHDFNIDNGTFVVDASTNRVGIGTSSPSTKLEIRNDVLASTDLDPTAIKLYNNSDGGSAIEFSNSVAGKSKISFGVEGTGASTDETYFAFSTSVNAGSLTERMRIDSSGDVLIGTTSAYGTNVLNVNGGIAIDGRNASTPGLCEKSDLDTGIWWPTTDTIAVTNGGSESMRIDSSGNLGIGITNPAYKLVVSNGGNGGLEFGPDGIAAGTSFIQAYDRAASQYDALRLYSSQYQFFVGAGNRALDIDTAGNVIIGGQTPGDAAADNLTLVDSGNAGMTLHAGDTSYASIYFKDSSSSNIGYIQYKQGDDFMRFGVNGSQRMRIDANGNVGIGTTSPNGRLQFDNGLNTRKIVLYEGANNNYQFYGFGIEGSTLVYSTYASTDDHVFFSGASASSRNELMRIKGDGNVDISSGYITSQVPAFNAYNPAATSSGNIIICGQTRFNQGNHFSTTTGAFTAPVAGVYHFTFAILTSGSGSPDYHRILFEINTSGTSTSYGDTLEEQAGSQYSSATMSVTFYLNQNDYIRIRNQGAATYGTNYGSFSGHLVG